LSGYPVEDLLGVVIATRGLNVTLDGEISTLLSASVCERILREPAATVLLRLLGVRTARCARPPSFERGPCLLRLSAWGDVEIEVQFDDCQCRMSHGRARTLLQPSPLSIRGGTYEYQGPLSNDVAALLKGLASAFNLEGSIPLVSDLYVPHLGFCRPKLGCTSHRLQWTQLDSELDSRALYPTIIVPTAFGWFRVRVTTSIVAKRMPWMCVKKGEGGYLALLCSTGSGCSFRVDVRGKVRLTEGHGWWFESRRCSPPFLFKVSPYGMGVSVLLSNGYTLEYRSPPIWVLGGGLVVGGRRGVGKGGDEVELLVWNPLPIAKNQTLIFSGMRVVEASAKISPYQEFERVYSEMDRLILPMPRFGLGLARVRLKKLPKLLLSRKRS
jgi:hypothetical protein